MRRFCVVRIWSVATLAMIVLGMGSGDSGFASAEEPKQSSDRGQQHSDQVQKVKCVISGGFETNPVDRGRPVSLVAGALNVRPEVFREAFSRVRPAAGGRAPHPAQVRENKAVLLSALGPLGVTNDRLDQVSDYYRVAPGQKWPSQAAEIEAVIKRGAVTGFEIKDGGHGYSSPPKIAVPGYQVPPVTVELAFSTDFERNGAIKAIEFTREKKSR